MSKKNELSINDVLVQCEGNIVSDMDGDKVMLSIQNGKYYNLGKVGGDIWSAVITPTPISEVVSVIKSTYEVEAEICEQEVISFLQHLLNEDLVRFADAG